MDGVVKTVYVAGAGTAVVLMPEMPGISPDVLRLARWVRDAGFTVYVPSLFGIDGAYPTVEGGAEVVRRACVSAEFRAFAGGGTSPLRRGYVGSRAKPTPNAEVRESARSVCASPATSHSPWRLSQPSSRQWSTTRHCRWTTPPDSKSATRTRAWSETASCAMD